MPTDRHHPAQPSETTDGDHRAVCDGCRSLHADLEQTQQALAEAKLTIRALAKAVGIQL